jgi:hypothetical protein
MSCHPEEKRMATFENRLHILHKLPLSETNITKGPNTDFTIAETNYKRTKQVITFYCQIIDQKKSIVHI